MSDMRTAYSRHTGVLSSGAVWPLILRGCETCTGLGDVNEFDVPLTLSPAPLSSEHACGRIIF